MPNDEEEFDDEEIEEETAGGDDDDRAKSVEKRRRAAATASRKARNGFLDIKEKLQRHVLTLYVDSNGRPLPYCEVYPTDVVFVVSKQGGLNREKKPWGIHVACGTGRIQAAGGEDTIVKVKITI